MNLSKVGYVSNIEDETLSNENFRKVLYTGKHCQLVVMTIQAGEDIGMEVHGHVDQFIRVEEGEAEVILNGEVTKVKDDFAFIIPAGVEHNVVNTGKKALKLYTIYSPANHPEGTVHKDRAEAMEAEEHEHHN